MKKWFYRLCKYTENFFDNQKKMKYIEVEGDFTMDSIIVAKQIIYELYKNRNEKLKSAVKLQKLLYIVYGLHLVIEGKTIFQEKPLCLPYGPVFEKVYKYFESKKIDKQDYNSYEQNNLNSDVKEIIEKTIEVFGDNTATALSEWSHREGGAWSKIASNSNSSWGQSLEEEDIIEEFNEVIGL